MACLERNDFAFLSTLREAIDGRLIQADVEIAGMHADQLLPAITQVVARLPVDVDDDQMLVDQKECVSRVIDERAESRLAGREFVLRLPPLCDVLHGAELAQRPTLLVERHIALAVDDPHRAVCPYNPVLDVVARTTAQRLLAGSGGFLAVISVDETDPAILPLRKIERLYAENAARLVRQRDAAVDIVTLPPADMCDFLRRFRSALALPQTADGDEAGERLGKAMTDLLKETLLFLCP